MSRPVPSPVWPQYPEIPIHLDIRDDLLSPLSARSTQRTSPSTLRSPVSSLGYTPTTATSSAKSFKPLPSTPGRFPIKITVEPPHDHTESQKTPKDRNYGSISPPSQDPRAPLSHPPILKVPKIPQKPFLPQPPRFGQYSLPSRPDAAKLHQVPPCNIPQKEGKSQWKRKKNTNNEGLGIQGPRPLILPSIHVDPPLKEKISSPNIAQRIEWKLWRYSNSDNVIERWLLEIISWSFSFLCMSSIISILIYLNDKQVPKLPLDINLTTLISVLSRIASAALLLPTAEALGQLKWNWFQQGNSRKMWDFEIFDEASRGPWGSFLLLMRTKGRSLAAMGATITILALALDPFFQQVINFPERWVELPPTEANCTIPRIVTYNPEMPVVKSGGVQFFRTNDAIQPIADKFFYNNGTEPVNLGNGTRADIPVTCPTGKCTWPRYETLGICSQCEDISEYLSYACLTTQVDWTRDLRGFGYQSTYPNRTVCGYFLNATSEAPVLMTGFSTNSNSSEVGETLTMRMFPLVGNPLRETYFDGSINFRNVSDSIVDFLVVGTAGGVENVYRREKPIAKECILSWCVKTLESSYNLATYEEKIVSRAFNYTKKPFPWSTRPIGNITATDYITDININVMDSLLGKSQAFKTDNITALGFEIPFEDILPSFVTFKNSSNATIRYANYRSTPFTRNYTLNYWMRNNISDFLERFAVAATNAMRSSPVHYEFVYGTVHESRNFVEARWQWLSLPLALLFFSFVFLIATILQSSNDKGEVGVWKTSAIATLLYGLPVGVREKITAATKIGTPRAKAKELKVELLPNKHGWRISGSLLSPLPRTSLPPTASGWI